MWHVSYCSVLSCNGSNFDESDDKRLFVDTVGTGLFESVYKIDKEKLKCSNKANTNRKSTVHPK